MRIVRDESFRGNAMALWNFSQENRNEIPKGWNNCNTVSSGARNVAPRRCGVIRIASDGFEEVDQLIMACLITQRIHIALLSAEVAPLLVRHKVRRTCSAPRPESPRDSSVLCLSPQYSFSLKLCVNNNLRLIIIRHSDFSVNAMVSLGLQAKKR